MAEKWLKEYNFNPRGTGGPQNITPARLPTNNSQLNHIFGNRPEHLPDTPANRQLLTNTTGNRNNLLGIDRYGTQWFSRIQSDGTQVRVRVRNGVIQNGGVNNIPEKVDRLRKHQVEDFILADIISTMNPFDVNMLSKEIKGNIRPKAIVAKKGQKFLLDALSSYLNRMNKCHFLRCDVPIKD